MTQAARCDRGFTLVEIMIAMAVMTIMILGFSQMVVHNMKAQRGVQDISDLNTFTLQLQQLMGVTPVCTTTLVNNPALSNLPVSLNVTDTTSLQATNLEIDYPMPAPSPSPGMVPNPNSPLAKPGMSYNGWTVAPDATPGHVNADPLVGMGLRVRGPAGSANAYFVDVVVNFDKKVDAQGVPLSFGTTKGQRIASTVIVSTTPPNGAGQATVQGCIGGTLGASSSAPVVSVFTSGSSTYSPPSGASWLEVTLVGGGGGGSAASPGGAGGATSFGSVSANGGLGGGSGIPSNCGYAIVGPGGSGGVGTATRRSPGASGGPTSGGFAPAGGCSYAAGGAGGASPFGGAGSAGTYGGFGGNASPGTGSGGGGAGGNATGSYWPGAGGGAGESAYLVIGSPASSYAYAVGAGGAGGAGGGPVGAAPGAGAGGSGVIIVVAH